MYIGVYPLLKLCIEFAKIYQYKKYWKGSGEKVWNRTKDLNL